MRTVTLAQLRQDIQNQADVAGLTARHGATLINRLVNQSRQRFRERISGEGARHFLAVATGTLGVGATSGFPFLSLDLSGVSGIVRTYGIDIKQTGGAWKRLEHESFDARCDYGGGHPGSVGEPRVWAEWGTTKYAILPPPDRAYDYVAYYLPVLDDLAADSDTWNGVSGWETYVVWDVVVQVQVREQGTEAYQLAVMERDRAWSDILRNATRVTGAGGATIGRDSAGAKGFPGRGGRFLPPLGQ